MTLDKQQLEQAGAAYAGVVTKAWQDAAYKARLLADPRAVLGEAGLSLPSGVEVVLLEDTNDTVHLVLPAADVRTLSDSALEDVAGGIDPVTGTIVAIGLGSLIGAFLIGTITAGGVVAAMGGKKGK